VGQPGPPDNRDAKTVHTGSYIRGPAFAEGYGLAREDRSSRFAFLTEDEDDYDSCVITHTPTLTHSHTQAVPLTLSEYSIN
jgi:inorganic pyrophosphatase